MRLPAFIFNLPATQRSQKRQTPVVETPAVVVTSQSGDQVAVLQSDSQNSLTQFLNTVGVGPTNTTSDQNPCNGKVVNAPYRLGLTAATQSNGDTLWTGNGTALDAPMIGCIGNMIQWGQPTKPGQHGGSDLLWPIFFGGVIVVGALTVFVATKPKRNTDGAPRAPTAHGAPAGQPPLFIEMTVLHGANEQQEFEPLPMPQRPPAARLPESVDDGEAPPPYSPC